jgi:O-antigen/teichoic acid export membrane protein
MPSGAPLLVLSRAIVERRRGGYLQPQVLRSHLARTAILVVLLACILWLTVTVINAIRLGSRDSDAAIYWPAVALLVLIAALLACGAWLVSRHRRTGPR